MIYAFFKFLFKLVLRVFFRKIYFSGAHHISLNKPTILACNHPNSFLDALLVGIFIQKPIYFLTRSDVFNAPWKKWFLTKIHLIPIYRLEEGAGNLHKNQDTFAQCYQILKNKGIILIFSEGLCVLEKRLRPLRKGTARLAFGAELANDFNLDLEIVPIGINYTAPMQFRKEAMIGISNPISVKALKPLYQENQAKAIKVINAQIESALRHNMVIIENPENEQPVEEILVQARLHSPTFYNASWFSSSRNHLETEKNLALTDLSQTQAEQILVDLNIKPVSMNKTLFWLVAGFPVFLMGLILNILPLYLAKIITKNKVKYPEFYASVLLVLGMILYLLYWPFFSLLAAKVISLSFLSILVLLPLSGYLALLWYDQNQFYKAIRKAKDINP